DIPVFQLSLDYRKDPRYHYELAKELMPLREKGVLIIGSGNMVHNLGMIDWRQADSGFSWAETANQKFRDLIESGDHDALINYHTLGREIAMSIPTPEHYLPLLYSLGLQGPKESLKFYNDKTVMGSISMTSVRIG
ncbi:MAG TPA: class III extradiol ring-cleavage dioxygenase, partial [Saprospiraceae bacterium]|nr:class III extradiol ring-cleavage dioxygenase [Saprospiraceae bacterium]